MTETEETIEGSLTDAIGFTDPIETVFEINEQMLYRISRIRYVFMYAFWAGLLVSIACILALVWVLATGTEATTIFLLVGTILASSLAAWFAHAEGPFLNEYQVLAGAVSRARDWEPHPSIPEGKDALARYLKYLEHQDDRFAFYYGKKSEYLKLGSTLKGKSKKNCHFDASFVASSFPWDDIEESVRIFVRAVPIVTQSDMEAMKKDAEDVIPTAAKAYWVFKPTSFRFVLLQTGSANFSEEIIGFANENQVEYNRLIGGSEYDWSFPIELVAEDASRVYNFGTVYFG